MYRYDEFDRTLVLELADDGRTVRSVEFMSAGELLELELH